jgi:hypothetical protein
MVARILAKGDVVAEAAGFLSGVWAQVAQVAELEGANVRSRVMLSPGLRRGTGLRDLIGLMVLGFARIGAALGMDVGPSLDHRSVPLPVAPSFCYRNSWPRNTDRQSNAAAKA